jgi:hypothetical protein
MGSGEGGELRTGEGGGAPSLSSCLFSSHLLVLRVLRVLLSLFSAFAVVTLIRHSRFLC